MVFRTLHISLAFLVYLSSIGYTLNQHFCKGDLIHSSLFLPAEKCENHSFDPARLGIDVTAMPACCLKALEAQHKDCCEDTAELKKLDIETSFQDSDLADSPNDLPVLSAILSTKRLWDPSHLSDNKGLIAYRPPPLSPDFVILFQVFRI
jgi:hypothetical protein